MASPQVENGYTKIADELLSAIIRWRLSSYECRVLLFLIRKTYGWGKKEDWVSRSQFASATGIRESHISRALSMLIKQNIVTKGGTGYRPKWSIQKDFDQWKRVPKGVRVHKPVPKGVRTGTKGGTQPVPKGGYTIDTLTTDTLTINNHGPAGGPPDINKTIDIFYEINPTINYAHQGHRHAIEKLYKHYGKERVIKVARFACQVRGLPFAPRISTPSQLLEKWADLEAYALSKKNELQNKSILDV